MRLPHLTMALPLLLAATAVTSAGEPTKIDLTKIDRTIKKELAYQTKSPKYCLLVFGPEAKTRVWLVQDGDRLYVDRNGNGDLTEDGECIAAKKGDYTIPAEGVFEFEAGDIPDGNLVQKNLHIDIAKIDYLVDIDSDLKKRVAADPKFRGILIGIDAEIPGKKGNRDSGRIAQYVHYRDTQGLLEFGDSPRTAPVIHFAGTMKITLYGKHQCTVGREEELYLGIATPGLGAGATAFFCYEELIPAKAFPVVEIAYPSSGEGKPPVRELYEIKDRC
ncbi:MAG: hypothetical protein HY040_01740 [Planctomycetes bacterium]|nr:hypothetical protein [Planctomycetota bacterium]